MEPLNWPLIILYGILIGSLLLAFGIGTQDETMATTYGSGSLHLRSAIILALTIAFLGVLFLSTKVGKTIGEGILSENTPYDLSMLLAIVLGTAIWLIIAGKMNIPVSTTHSVVSAVIGVGIIWGIHSNAKIGIIFNWNVVGEIFLGWVLSPILGFFSVMIVKTLIIKYLRPKSKNLLEVEKQERWFRRIILGFAILNQFSRAGNDAGNAVGLYYAVVKSQELNQLTVPINESLFIFLIALAFLLGLGTFGKQLIQVVGTTTGELHPSEAVAIESTVAIDLFICTLLGLPVSGGHILIFTMIGNAWMKGEFPDRKQFKRMVWWWILTIPLTAIMAGTTYIVLLLFLPS